MRSKYPELSDQLVCDATLYYVRDQLGAKGTLAKLREQHLTEVLDKRLTYESVVRILGESIRRGYLRPRVPPETKELELLREAYKADGLITDRNTVRVVPVSRIKIDRERALPPDDERTQSERCALKIPDEVANVGAAVLLRLILQLYRDGRGKSPEDRIRIGVGAGYTAGQVLQGLARLLRSRRKSPKLALHALTPGFSQNPRESPVAHFTFFENVPCDIEFIGLSAPPFATRVSFGQLREEPEFAKAYEQARDLDIVVSSLASADDPHGMLRSYLHEHHPREFDRLSGSGWRGDVQFCPYSDKPLGDVTDVRAVSLLDLADLTEMVAKGKQVLLLAAPCYKCGRLKTNAVAPLLRNKSLACWTEFVMDYETARTVREARLVLRNASTSKRTGRHDASELGSASHKA